MIADNGDVFYQINYPLANNLLPENYPAQNLILPANEIIHDRMNCFHHQLIGVPPICAAHWPMVKNLKILKNATKFFENGANPGGILTAPAGMSETDANAVKDYWNTNFSGTNSGKIAVIGADMKYTAFAFKAADSQLVEQMQPFVELGVDYFMLDCGGFPRPTTVELLIDEVLPALNR